VVKEFWQKAASQGGADFSRGQCNMTPTSREHCSRLQQSRSCRYWGLNDPFRYMHHRRDSMRFNGPDNRKIAPSVGISTTIHTWFLEPMSVSPPNDISIGSAVFCRSHPCKQHTDRQTHTQTTLHAASVAIGRVYAKRAMRPDKIKVCVWKCIIVPNFVEIGQTAAEIWLFLDFSLWRPPPSWICKIGNK